MRLKLPEDPLERWALGAAALGVLMWLAAPAFMDVSYDGNTYVATGHGVARTGGLVLVWGDVLSWGPERDGHSHHFPPAYPVYLGAVFSVFGYGHEQARFAAIAMAAICVATVYFATRDLYGRRAAAVAGGLMALNPWVLWVAGQGFSENLAMTFFALTMWGIVRSLKDERHIVLAGLFAGLAYLTRAGMGAFFLVAGLGGLAWRIWHRGFRRTFGSVWYLTAIAIFGGILVLWAWRNVHLYGWPNWETSIGSRYLPHQVRNEPGLMAKGLLMRAPLLLAVFAPWLLLLWREAGRSLRKIRDEHTSALWLAVFLVWFLGVVFAAFYWSVVPTRDEAWRFDNMRYAITGTVPLLWGLVREADFDDAGFRMRLRLLGVGLVALCLCVFLFPATNLATQAAKEMEPFMDEGDTVEVFGSGKYAMYATLEDPEQLSVYLAGSGGGEPAFWRMWHYESWDGANEGYTLVAEKHQTHPLWPFRSDHMEVWVRDDVQRERKVQLGPMDAGW